MVADVILTITMVAIASGAVAEFQLRIADICFATDGTLMGVVRCFRPGCFAELYGFIVAACLGARPFVTLGEKVWNIFAHKQQIVAQCHKRE